MTSLTENVSSTLAGDVYSRGNVATGSYTYDKNGNMMNDSRRALNFGYNVLNLLSEVKTTGGELKAKYDYLADGTMHIPVDTRSVFPVISVQSPVSIQYRWQS